jgi:hypothetical protein
VGGQPLGENDLMFYFGSEECGLAGMPSNGERFLGKLEMTIVFLAVSYHYHGTCVIV